MSKLPPETLEPVMVVAHPGHEIPIARPIDIESGSNHAIPIGRSTINQAQFILRNAIPFTNPVVPLEDGAIMTEREHALLDGPYKLSRRIRFKVLYI
jgi:hypothetical protein